MIYQIRFLRSEPIGHWLRSTTSILNVIIPKEAWPNPSAGAEEKRKLLQKALAFGLLSFVTSRSLCGSDPLCDSGCRPIDENKNPDRANYLVFGQTTQYLVEGSVTLTEMSDRLARAVLLKVPNAVSSFDEIHFILRDSLSSHLFENINCHLAPFCRYSKPLNLKWSIDHAKGLS